MTTRTGGNSEEKNQEKANKISRWNHKKKIWNFISFYIYSKRWMCVWWNDSVSTMLK